LNTVLNLKPVILKCAATVLLYVETDRVDNVKLNTIAAAYTNREEVLFKRSRLFTSIIRLSLRRLLQRIADLFISPTPLLGEPALADVRARADVRSACNRDAPAQLDAVGARLTPQIVMGPSLYIRGQC
jgi:hypothetical protein